jgi:ABC-type glycerol-3-phosphate transport system substrate-binding protein
MKDHIGAFVTPAPRGKPPKGFLIGQVLFMTKKSAAKPAAWNFMRAYMDKRWEVKRSTMLGYASFRSDITDPQVTGHPIIKVGIQTIQSGVFQPDFPEWLEYRDQIKTELQKVLLGQKGVRPALDDANRALAAILK